MLTKSNAVGYAVLALVMDRLNDEEVREIHVEPYLNGRESGFGIMFSGFFQHKKGLHDRKFAFSEMRGTDAIVVYESDSCGFSMQGNGLNDEIYRSSCSFEGRKIMNAVDHIVERMRETKTPA